MEFEIEFKLKDEVVAGIALLGGIALGFWLASRTARGRRGRNLASLPRNGLLAKRRRGPVRNLRARLAS